ncbi:AAA family ATPase [Flavobacterium pectinovorum]|uniref:ATP-dependent Clp protease ATP-binding subunit ClpA n=1 Tax=Flavobacterium pectinovorum TaxID=29533 RepID=A0AB36NYZ0_9FLAO|nr:ATP-dependent Clp protease ATP-binding subunit [Flavobacterium pectinovorum]OXB03285.1 Clp protease ClpA [Flavobacterium pectinovorum]SHL21089.1 ATP-dependent Clp protease ATP-binding subunit ClpA [Flavobacterium pectinovorum]
MNELDYSPSLLSAIKSAKSLAIQDGHSTYGVAHLAYALLFEPTGLVEVLKSLSKDIEYIKEWFDVRKEVYTSSQTNDNSITSDTEVEHVFTESNFNKIRLGADSIDAFCVFIAIIKPGLVYSDKQIDGLNLSDKELLKHFGLRNNQKSFSLVDNADEQETIDISYCDTLYKKNIIEEGSSIIGRNREVRLILENIERYENHGILLIGESGIGKTSIIKNLIHNLHETDPNFFEETLVLSLNVSKLVANCSNENEISKKLIEIFEKLSKNGKSILFIDDIQVLLNSSNSKSNAVINIINTQLTQGDINIIASIDADSYRKSIEGTTINGKFENIFIEELDYSLLVECLNIYKNKLEKHYKIAINEEVIQEAIHLSKRFYKEKKLPYGAIDLLDRTASSVIVSNANSLVEIVKIKEQIKESDPADESKMSLLEKEIYNRISCVVTSKIDVTENSKRQKNEPVTFEDIEKLASNIENIAKEKITVVTKSEILAVVSNATGIPLGKISAGEKEKLLTIEDKLQERVKGQSHAIKTLSEAIIESRSGLSNPKQPIGSFFFLGPTGTGKTELTKTLAELLFDDENAMIRFDMSEFKEEHSAALLYGAPPGYVGYEEGGMLVNKIRQKPYSVVLFDEIEKAHSSVYDVFLQIMDEGKIHDKLGREGDFSNAIIIFTSNIGSQWIQEQIESGHLPTSNQLIEIMSQHFRPEFLGRLTEVVPFAPINIEIAKAIFKLHLNRLQEQLISIKNISFDLSDGALEYLTNKGFSKKYGARPIAGIVRTYLKKTISKLIISEAILENEAIVLDIKEDEFIWGKK